MNNTSRTFVFVALVTAILLACYFLPQLSIGTHELRPVNVLSDVLPEPQHDVGAIPIVPLPEVSAPQQTHPQQTHPQPLPQREGGSYHDGDGGLSADSTAGLSAPLPQREGQGVGQQVGILDYSQGQPGGMYSFYQRLAEADGMERPVRVAYYGDSFIEGDIFTADLRELLQDEFGGSGVGWVDCGSQVYGFRQSVVHSFSGLTEYEVVQRPFSHSNQGIAQRYFTAAEGARITYRGARQRRHQDSWDRAIFYLRSDGGLTLRTTLNNDTTLVDTIRGSQNLLASVASLPQCSISNVSYMLSNIGAGTLLYGVALEPRSGVVVDNFSMRGSAGYTLAKIPEAMLMQFAAQRPYDLIVLHYGLNVANANQQNYRSYIDQMGRAIEHLRQAYPQAAILVVSMPDRDQRTDAGLRTMRGVEALVAWQQLMASEHGVSFFNLFEAMGGRESMKELVDRQLANKDYTHINFAGGRHLAPLLFGALMDGYHSYGF